MGKVIVMGDGGVNGFGNMMGYIIVMRKVFEKRNVWRFEKSLFCVV